MPDAGHGDHETRKGNGTRSVSLLEIVASGAGLLLTLGMLAFIGWEALTRPGDRPPADVVESRQVAQIGDIWVLNFAAMNRTPSTAANVEIEGTLRQDGREVETGRTSLDFVPGGSTVRGGIFFQTDPRAGEVELRALGYAQP